MPEDRPAVRRRDLLFPQASYEIRAACIAVHEALGCGLLEKVYENSLAHELRKRGFRIAQQFAVEVRSDGRVVGEYVADIVVDGQIIVEVKATERDDPVYKAQLINYLKATGLPLGFLVNFGKEFFSFDRVVFTKQ